MIDPFGEDAPHVNDPTHYPVDHRLEAAFIGKILLDQSMDGLDFLKLPDIDHSGHRELFKRMREKWEADLPLDPVLITDRDPELYSLLIDCQDECLKYLGTPAVAYARKLRDLAKKRRMLPFLSKAAEMSMNGVSADEVVQYLQDGLDSDERRSDRDTWQARRASGLIEPPQPREWLLEGLLYRGQISMWFGPPGIKKTLALMDMCAALATGQNWLVRRYNQPDHASLVTFHAKRKARILWIDFDNGEFETEIRVRAALQARGGLTDAEFYYISEASPWLALDEPSHVRRVIRLALEIGADVIVIDALGMVMGSVDENAPAVATVISKLKEMRAATGAAIACVHHPSKSGAQNETSSTYNAAGSAKFSNFFEWSIELRAGEEKDTIVANVVKHRGWAKVTKFAAELTYEHFGNQQPELAHELSSFKFYPAAIESTGEKRSETINDAVLTTLAQGEMNQSALIAAVKVEVETVLGKPVGEFAIRQEIERMAAHKEIVMSQSVPHRPKVYRLDSATPVDPVDRS